MAPNGATGQISAIGIRARDTVTNRDLNVYARSYIHYGNQNVQGRRNYTVSNGNNVFYPYVTAGCSLRSYDFDSDNDGAQSHLFDYLGPGNPLTVTHTNASIGFSSNDAWNNELILHASDSAAQRYGIWRMQTFSGNGANHVEIWASPETVNITPATTQPSPGSFRYYFPRNDGTAPAKPIFRQSVTTVVSGAATPTVGSPTRLRLGLAIRNPTPYPITFNASNLVNLTVPASTASVTRTYQGNFTTNCGVTQPTAEPTIGTTGAISWNPGTIPAGGSCSATYEVSVTPLATGRHLLTGDTASGSIANLLDETGQPFTFGPLCELAVETGTNYSSVPVSLGFVQSQQTTDGGVALQFETISESGSLSFRIVDADGAERLLATTPAQASSDHEPTSYTLSLLAPSAQRFYIDQVESGGNIQRFGPYRVGTTDGERLQRNTIDWANVARAQRAALAVTAELPASQRARIDVEHSGLYRIRFEDLTAAGIDMSGIPMAELALVADGAGLPTLRSSNEVFRPGQYIDFVADVQAQPYYGKRRSYWLERNAVLVRDMPRSSYYPDASAVSPQQIVHSVLDDNREYAAASPLADPWYLGRLQRSGSAPAVLSETLSARAADLSQDATLHLVAWGGLDYPDEGVDHAFAIALNGVDLGEYRFDGINPINPSWAIPRGLLIAGDNSVSLRLLATPFASDRINIESITLSYTGQSIADAGVWSLDQPATEGASAAASDQLFAHDFAEQPRANCSANCARARVSGFNTAPRVFRSWNGGIEQIVGQRADGADWLIATPLPGRYRGYSSAQTPAIAAAVTAASISPSTEFLIISDPAFIDALQPLRAARQAQGLATQIISTDAIYSAQRAPSRSADSIAAFLRGQASRGALRYMLLVGGDSYDYDDVLGLGSQSFVPTFYRRTSNFVGHAPSDLPYADFDGDRRPDLAIGRWPVRTAAEVQALITKGVRFAENAGSGGALRIADRASASYSFAAQNAIMLGATAYASPQSELALDSFEASAAGNSAARAQLQSAVNGGARWLNYFGHGSPYQWSSSGLLRASDLSAGLFSNASTPFLATQWGCWGAYYVLPQYDSLAHTLLASPSGAAALIGASTLSETGRSVTMASRLLPLLDSNPRLGDAWQQALISLGSEQPNAIDVLYGTTLLGDPTLPLR